MFAAAIVACWVAGVTPVALGTEVQAPHSSDEIDDAIRDRAAHPHRLPCSEVVSRLDHDRGVQSGHSTNVARIAKDMGTSVIWMEHCVEAYGRRPLHRSIEDTEGAEAELEKFESGEAEEGGPEDLQEGGARERVEHPEKERVIPPRSPNNP